MTKNIFKFEIPVKDTFSLEIPSDSKILHIATKKYDDRPYMWVLVDCQSPLRVRDFRLYGTGHDIQNTEDKEYVGSFQANRGNFVGHLFEITRR